MDTRPLGIFDSGIGGLTVVSRILEKLPRERILYFGDTARLPYGNKSPETVTRFSREITRFLLRRDAKAIVVACNSASALALDTLRRELTVEVIDVIGPGAVAAVNRTRSGRIGVIATQATVRSGAYRRALEELRKDVVVHEVATPLFVHLVEEGWTEGDIPERVAHHYLGDLMADGVDTVILGCTHYPLLAPLLSSVFGSSVELVDSANETANALAERLESAGLMAGPDAHGDLTCFASDVPADFARLGERFLGRPLGDVRPVEQTDLPWFER